MMLGKIVNINDTNAFISFQDEYTINVGVNQIPIGSKIGDTISIEQKPLRITNDKFVDFF
ncbi:hypothetical protein [Clostridium sp. DJ247]|uniref:hypothetical protein n=1 Tax=Clostridium sp. DJ247 TaxID=2726188 RepID=UPI0016297735|nr:hypothetical protein [Clostridium sp. DJ247]MBC2581279.1 hypothetical protein [Clostridium sp. DJ247]